MFLASVNGTETVKTVYLLQAVFFQTDDIQIKLFTQAVRFIYDYLSGQPIPLCLWQRGHNTQPIILWFHRHASMQSKTEV